MDIITCKHCQKKIQVPPELSGRPLQCPSCNQKNDPPPASQATSNRPTKKSKGKVVFACPSCQGKFQISKNSTKQTVACPHCQTAVAINPPDTAASGGSTKVKRRKKKTEAAPQKNAEATLEKKSGSASKKSSPDQAAAESKKDLFAPAKKKPKPAAAPSYKPLPTTPPASDASKASSSEGQADNATSLEKTAGADLETVVPASVVKPTVVTPTVTPAAQLPTQQPLTEPDAKTPQSISAPSAVETMDRFTPKPIDHLLPPKFTVHDPELFSSSVSGNEIMLPDAKGGATVVEKNIVHVEHEGERVSLVVLTPEQRERRRFYQNAIVMGIGFLLLAATIWMLLT